MASLWKWNGLYWWCTHYSFQSYLHSVLFVLCWLLKSCTHNLSASVVWKIIATKAISVRHQSSGNTFRVGWKCCQIKATYLNLLVNWSKWIVTVTWWIHVEQSSFDVRNALNFSHSIMKFIFLLLSCTYIRRNLEQSEFNIGKIGSDPLQPATDSCVL